MHKHIPTLLWLLLIISPQIHANEAENLQTKVAQVLPSMLQNIEDSYAYSSNSNNWSCLTKQYTRQIKQLEDRADAVLFFEHLLMEFADSHMTLNTNIQDSYRLHSPITVKKNKDVFLVDDFWQNQLITSKDISIGAELLSINGFTSKDVIENFPTLCLDKSQANNQHWIINKALAGQYSKPRIIELAVNGSRKTINLDQLKYRQTKQPLSAEKQDELGIIRINNSLGQTELIQAFDQAIDELSSTQGLVLDLRNTISGGDSYIARAIIGRFIEQDQAYQKHRFNEQRNGGPKVARLWTEYVSPRFSTYKQPLVVLVNRWTGSMGEGLAIGLHGTQRGHIIGSSMAGLLGAVYGFQLEGMGFGYQMPAEQLFHIDGTPRESFLPDSIAKPKDGHPDFVLNQAIQWLKSHKQAQSLH